MEIPRRKRTRLYGYNYSMAGAYFLTICTMNRKNILGHIVGGGSQDAPKVQLTSLGKLVEKYILSGNQMPGISVDKYVIMPNHIHIILFVEDGFESSGRTPANAKTPHFVSALKRLCHREAGFPFFQRDYNDHIIRGEADYLQIWQYIDNNPAQWVLDCFYQDDRI